MSDPSVAQLMEIPTDILQDRLGELLGELDGKIREIGPQLHRIGELRLEAARVDTELRRREGVQKDAR